MEENFIPRLSLGTLLLLLIEAKPKVAKSSHFEPGYATAGTEPRLLGDLIRILWPNHKDQWSESSLSGNTYNVKKGKKLSRIGWLPFDDSSFIDEGCLYFESKKNAALSAAKKFIDSNIDVSSEYKISILGRRLLELIILDDSILPETELPIKSNCSTIKKNEINSNMTFELEPLIVGLLYFITKNKINNEVGQETYNHWFGEPDDSNICHFKENAFNPVIFKNTSIDLINKHDVTINEDDQIITKTSSYLQTFDFKDYLERLTNEYSYIKTFVPNSDIRLFRDYFVCSNVSFLTKEKDECGTRIKTILKNATATELREQCSKFIVMTGTGGLGKSMMMNHLLLSAIDAFPNDKLVPVFVKLNEFKESTGYLTDFVLGEIKKFAPYITENQYVELLKNGTFLFLFDGLDEIETTQRTRFEGQLNDFTSRYSGNSFIISSREDSTFLSLSKYSIVSLLPLEKEQAINLIKVLEYGRNDPVTKERFIERLDKELYDLHSDFASVPLLLTIMFITYENSGNVPSAPHVFYSKAYDALSESHDANKSGYDREYRTKSNGLRLKEYLGAFCFVTLAAGDRSFPEDKFEEYFNSTKEEMNDIRPDEIFTYKDFAEDIMYCLCLMTMSSGNYCFVHDKFQEYFCAYWLSKKDADDIEEIGKFVEENPSEVISKTEMFSMLYDMNTTTVENRIIAPYLKDLLFTGETDIDRYLHFLNTAFGFINFNYGDYYEDNNKPISYLYDFITNKKKIKTVRDLNDFEYLEDLVVQDYVWTDNGSEENFENILAEFDKTALLHDEECPEISGARMQVCVQDMIDNKDNYEYLINKLYDDYCSLKEEYTSLIIYYNQIIKNKEKASKNLRSVLANKKKA